MAPALPAGGAGASSWGLRAAPALLLGVLLAAAPGCEAVLPGRGATLELDGEEIELPAGARVHDVPLDARSADAGAPAPPVAVRRGDVVRFSPVDVQTHALAFDTAPITSQQRDFLVRSGQVASPPLLTPDHAWAVWFEEAPEGDYPFACLLHGRRGLIRLTD